MMPLLLLLLQFQVMLLLKLLKVIHAFHPNLPAKLDDRLFLSLL